MVLINLWMLTEVGNIHRELVVKNILDGFNCSVGIYSNESTLLSEYGASCEANICCVLLPQKWN